MSVSRLIRFYAFLVCAIPVTATCWAQQEKADEQEQADEQATESEAKDSEAADPEADQAASDRANDSQRDDDEDARVVHLLGLKVAEDRDGWPMVLDVNPVSEGWNGGFRKGDRILTLDGIKGKP